VEQEQPVSAAADILQQFSQKRAEMLAQLRRVVVGQGEVLEQILDVAFKRVQFTPDLMPSDITGTMVLDEPVPGKREFRFVRGPVFTNILLADEINRTPPKTQAALLQAMQEREVSAGQETYKLPDPFFVIATQNPIEQEGTYPLPEAQLDRFMFTIKVDYPTYEDEKKIIALAGRTEAVEMTKVLSAKAILNLQKVVHATGVGETVIDYIARLVRATRPGDPTAPDFIKRLVDFGAGPRAGIFLAEAGRAFAAMAGEPAVTEADVQKAAIPVLRHRIGTNFQAQAEGMTSEDLVRKLLTVITPREEAKYAKRR
jgi:MoxR-like ATPase